MSRRLALVAVAALALVGGLAGAVGAGRAGARPAVQSAPLTAAIYPGSCRKPKSTAAYPLNELTKPEGDVVRGLPFVSETAIDATLPALQSDPYALIVAHDANHPDNALACGDLNRVTTADGSTMLVGLFEQKSSLYTGIAVLTADGERTTVRVYVARALNGGFGISGPLDDEETDEEVTDAVTVSIDDDELVADRTELTVGSTVEFTVTNEGRDRHEVVLERRGADEEPLATDDGDQAETEDLAPGEAASFVYTFEDEGAYQLADHIGENYRRGFVFEFVVVDPDE
jgi:plastocyanin